MRLNYKSFGQGEAIIILHGLFGMLDNWQTIAKQLADHYQLILVDQRNHGKSFHSNEMSYTLMAHDLKFLMDDLQLKSAHIIGHSMGGKTAMMFASMYPSLTTSLVVVDIAPKAYEGGHESLFEALLGVDIDKVSSRKDVDEQLKKSIPDDGVRLFLMKNLTRNPTGGYRWKANFEILHEHYHHLMNFDLTGSHFARTLFIRGELSDYIQDDDEQLIYSLFPTAEIEDIVGAGHWVHAAKPKELIELVQSFLSTA